MAFCRVQVLLLQSLDVSSCFSVCVSFSTSASATCNSHKSMYVNVLSRRRCVTSQQMLRLFQNYATQHSSKVSEACCWLLYNMGSFFFMYFDFQGCQKKPTTEIADRYLMFLYNMCNVYQHRSYVYTAYGDTLPSIQTMHHAHYLCTTMYLTYVCSDENTLFKGVHSTRYTLCIVLDCAVCGGNLLYC